MCEIAPFEAELRRLSSAAVLEQWCSLKFLKVRRPLLAVFCRARVPDLRQTVPLPVPAERGEQIFHIAAQWGDELDWLVRDGVR